MEIPKEIQDLLDKLGVDPGAWGEMEGHVATPPLMQRQAETLVKLRTFLETMVAQDQAALSGLHEQLARLKHGGGS